MKWDVVAWQIIMTCLALVTIQRAIFVDIETALVWWIASVVAAIRMDQLKGKA